MDRDTVASVAGLIAGVAAVVGWYLTRGLTRVRASIADLRGRVEVLERREGEPGLTVEVRGLLPDRGISAPRVEPSRIEPPPSSKGIDRP